MLVIPEEDHDHINSENLSENTPTEDLKEFFTIIINQDKFYENMNFDDFIYGKQNEVEMEKDMKLFKSE